jgi:hypothetical protein
MISRYLGDSREEFLAWEAVARGTDFAGGLT